MPLKQKDRSRANASLYNVRTIRKMSKTVKTKKQKKNAASQTDSIDTMLELARLQEQVKLLTIENEHLRRCNSEEPLSSLRPVTFITSPSDVNRSTYLSRPSQANVNSPFPSSLKKKSKVPVRGCTCKGPCSSKICGCVKRKVHCGEFCKCNNITCRNQVHTENIANIKNISDSDPKEEISPVHVTEKPENMTIKKFNSFEQIEMDSQETFSVGNRSNTTNEDVTHFNPMKPKYELSRTPVNKVSVTKEDHQVPEELNEAEINYEDFQSRLAACSKCNRKFHPLRVKKHESCCKKL